MPQSAFESRFAGVQTRLAAAFGFTGKYIAPDQTSVSGLTLRRHTQDAIRGTRDGRDVWMETADVMVEVAALVLTPILNGRFEVAAQQLEVWTIAKRPEAKNGNWVCRCTRETTGAQGVKRSSANG